MKTKANYLVVPVALGVVTIVTIILAIPSKAKRTLDKYQDIINVNLFHFIIKNV